jgi:hypothetical protein
LNMSYRNATNGNRGQVHRSGPGDDYRLNTAWGGPWRSLHDDDALASDYARAHFPPRIPRLPRQQVAM